MFYIDQLRTPSFPIGLVKTESGFIVRSVETGLGRWTLVVAVISVDAYPILAFSELICHLENTRIGSSTVPRDSKETELGSSNQEASPSASKNTGIIWVPCCAWKCVPTAVSSGMDISEVLGCHLLRQISSQLESQKLLQGFVSHKLPVYLSVFDIFLTQWIMAILSKACKPDKFEPHNC